MKYLLLAIWCILLAGFFLEYRIVGQAVYGDGRYYWAFTRSLYFSQNIDISDEMAHFYSPEKNNQPAPFTSVPSLHSKTKDITNSFSLGISIIWLPLFFLADTFVVVSNSLGFHFIRNGYSDPYQIIVGVGNICFVTAALYLLSRILRQLYQQKVVILTLALLVFATNLFYYSSLDVVNSHPFSFLLVTLLLWSFLRGKKTREGKYLLLQGLLVGLLASNRTQDGLFLVIPLLASLLQNKEWRQRLSSLLQILLAAGIGYLPQIILLSIGQGHLALLPHTDQGFGLPTHLLGIIFDTKLGMLFYMPSFLLGLVGLILWRKKERSTATLFLSIFLLQYLLIGSWAGWHQASYSLRYFISFLPLLSLGVAEMISRLVKRFSLQVVGIMVFLLICQQMLMLLSFKLFLQDPTNVGGSLSRSGMLKREILQRIEHIL